MSESSAAPECPGCRRLRAWGQAAWNRGHTMGMDENERVARVAIEELSRERNAHAETNARPTQAMLSAEEARDRLRASIAELRDEAIAAAWVSPPDTDPDGVRSAYRAFADRLDAILRAAP